jgi:V/A-type H+-transporting ATPase subunit D
MQLLSHKAQIVLAKQGRDLLEHKYKALMKEFLRVADTAMKWSDALQLASDEARRALARAEVYAGSEAIRSAALATQAELPLDMTFTSVMGVKVPIIEQKDLTHSILERGFSITGSSITIDEAASAFEIEMNVIIRLAEFELRLTRIADELQRTSRRLNALEHVLIPQFEDERDYIQMMLDERERSDHFQLKLVKRLVERHRESSTDVAGQPEGS